MPPLPVLAVQVHLQGQAQGRATQGDAERHSEALPKSEDRGLRVRQEVTFACVLRSGGSVYAPHWVEKLAAGIRRFHPDADIVCLSDVDVPGVRRIPLKHPWPGWWAKMCAYQDGLFTGRRVIMFDLDTAICGPLLALTAYTGRRAVLQDFYDKQAIGTGVVMWEGDAMAHVFEAFATAPAEHMRNHRARSDRFTKGHIGSFDKVQAVAPGAVVSYKAHVRKQGRIPKGASVICFHGNPKPFALPKDDFVRQWWDGTQEAAA